MNQNTQQTPPIDSRMLSEAIRRATESLYSQISPRLNDLQRQQQEWRRQESPQVYTINGLPMPVPSQGAVCFRNDEAIWYYVDSDYEWVPLAGGVASDGKPYSTLVIAARDTKAANAAQADFFCDGVGDEAEINAALIIGGQVLLLDGTFVLSTPIAMPDGTTLAGMGMSATRLSMTPDEPHISCENLEGSIVRDISFIGTGRGIEIDHTIKVHVIGCEFLDLQFGIWYGTASGSVVSGCSFHGCGLELGM